MESERSIVMRGCFIFFSFCMLACFMNAVLIMLFVQMSHLAFAMPLYVWIISTIHYLNEHSRL